MKDSRKDDDNWIKNFINNKYPKKEETPFKGKIKDRPAMKSNPHQPTVDLLNKILMSKDCPDNIRVDTLRCLALLLEAEKGDNYVMKDFMKFLKRGSEAVEKKKQIQKQKASGGWITK